MHRPTGRDGENHMPDFTGLRKILEKNDEKWYVLYRAHRYSEDDASALETRPGLRM